MTRRGEARERRIAPLALAHPPLVPGRCATPEWRLAWLGAEVTPPPASTRVEARKPPSALEAARGDYPPSLIINPSSALRAAITTYHKHHLILDSRTYRS